jgi:hypothetical protein
MCSVAAALLEQRRRLERDDWRSWNFSRARARRLLRGDWKRPHADVCRQVKSWSPTD